LCFFEHFHDNKRSELRENGIHGYEK
jgi:hypothetical protein